MLSFPPMPRLTITSPETIQACKSLPLQPTDIFICSYPKSGTTWTQHIVLSLILANRRFELRDKKSGKKPKGVDADGVDCAAGGKGDDDKLDDIIYEHVSDFAPFYEIDAHWSEDHTSLAQSVRNNHDRLGRRMFNTHLRWDMLPKHHTPTQNDHLNNDGKQTLRPSCGKFIYVTRNLPDVCASFYHHLSNQKEGTYTENFETFARDWMEGKVAFGSPLHHLLSFAEGFSDNNYECDKSKQIEHSGHDRPLLLLSYEGLKENLRHHILRIMKFLNLNYIPIDVLDNEILPTFDFLWMRENSQTFQPKSVTWLNGFQFLRKGEVGDGRKLMNGECNDGDISLVRHYEEWIKKEGYKENIGKIFDGNDTDNIVCDNNGASTMEVFLTVVDAL